MLLPKRVWKDIRGYEGLYQVSNLGEIKSLNYARTKRSKVMSPGTDRNGYKFIYLWKNKSKERFSVHRLVANAFIPNPNNLPEVNHKNEIKCDNRLTNLEWCTREYNNNYGTARKRAAQTIKGKMANGKNPAAKKVICINTGEIFECIREAGNKYNIEASHITDCCKRRRKSCGKHPLTKERLKWKYY